MNELTWTCHVCGDERSDARISVLTRDISAKLKLPLGTASENVRYCNDRDECIEGAQSVSFTKEVQK